MSWKSFITTGLLCVLASPVFAVGPTLSLVAGGAQASGKLDANSNWIWSVQIAPDYSLVPDATGTPVAAELGFTSNNTVSAATIGSGFDTLNPGTSIFGFEVPGSCNANGNPCGIAINPTGSKQVFSAIGSPNSTAASLQYLTLTVARPVTTSAGTDSLSTILVSGAYGGNGRIAQITGGTSGGPYTTGNTDTFGGAGYSFTMRARAGDTNLDGTISIADYSTLAAAYGQPGVKQWFNGDFNGDNTVSISDYSMLAANFGAAHNYTVGPTTPGAGSGGGLSSGNVPEPASVALMGLACLGGLGVIRRKR